VLRESDFWAAEADRGIISVDDVSRAVEQQIWRADRIRQHSLEAIDRGILLISVDGEETGQINGLSVLSVGNFRFGKPSRITVRVRMGSGKVVDIERETRLGGPLHSKGVLILSGYLAANFALDLPVSLWASIVFEQSYGGVDGDSASSAELYALLSALAEAPIKQSFAVTGSVNQYGEVQAIGGVNEKIEGFYDVCAARGLSGDQGVLIPATNVKHLMLRQDVVAAAERGQFRVIPVDTIAQGIELLTGIAAGTRDAKGRFPADSINGRVEARLRQFAKARQVFAKHADDGDDDSDEDPTGDTP
jgi:predicted ATP-dependent protease